MTEKLLLGVDIGTYSSKGVLTRPDGHVLEHCAIEHDLSVPRPGWAEHDPERIWMGEFVTIAKSLLARPRYDPRDVGAVGVSAIGPCLVAVDEHDRAVGPGILYGIDTRATEEIADLDRLYGRDEIFATAGSFLTTQAVGPKILWLRRNQPETYARARYFHSAADYIVLRLTGEHVMDAYTASLYAPLFDLAAGSWSDRFSSQITELTRLPSVRYSTQIAGEITNEAAAATGLAPGTPVTVGTVDAVAEAVSVGAIRPGDLMCMYGTTAFFILATPAPVREPTMWAVCHALEGLYGVAAGMATSGSLTRWFREEFARDLSGDRAYDALAKEAGAVPPGSLGLITLPYFSGERTPINDPLARGVICGLTLAHGREHVYRSLLEGTAFGIAHNLKAMAASGAEVRRIVAVGGGVKNPLWLQIVSDVSGFRQEVPAQTIGAAYGDAFLAGLGSSIIRGVDTLHDSWVTVDHIVEPSSENHAAYQEYFDLYCRLYRDSSQVQHALAERGLKDAHGMSHVS